MDTSDLVDGRPRRFRAIFVCSAALAAALVAAFQLYVGGILNPDGVAYADLADAILRADFHSFVIAYWGPLYPALIAATFAVFRPEALNELWALYGLNSVIFCLFLVLFFRFLKALGGRQTFDPWFYFVGFSSVVFCSVSMIGVALITPDLLVAAFGVALALFLLRVIDGRLTGTSSITFGVVLGLGYLAKMSLLPLGLVVIFLGGVVSRHDRRALVLLMRTLIIFVVIVAFWALPLSIMKGRPTLGDIAKLTYSWHVRTVKNWIHWTGGPASAGVPIHPPKQLSERPRVFAFDKQFPHSTYPLWYDPSYWYEGLRDGFAMSQQVRATREAARAMETMCRPLIPVFAALVVLLISSGRLDRSRWRRVAPILTMALIGIGMYMFVYVERRYVGGYVVLLVVTLLWPLSVGHRLRAVYAICCLLIGLSLLIATAQKLADDFYQRKVLGIGDNRSVAAAILREGVPQESRIAFLSEGFRAIGWARLAHLHIVSDLEQDDVPLFWAAPADQQIAILQDMRTHGADFVIASSVRRNGRPLPWRRIGDTGLFLLRSQDVP